MALIRFDAEMVLKDRVVDIRPARADDMPFIAALLNHFTETSGAIFVDDPAYSVSERLAWFGTMDWHSAVFVAHTGDHLLGYGSFGPHSDKSGYRYTAVHSVYVHPDAQRRGVGARLIETLIETAKVRQYHVLIGIIDSEQTPSLGLHRKHNFIEVGRMAQIGCKFGEWRTVVYVQLILDDDSPNRHDTGREQMLRAADAPVAEPLA